MDLGCPLWQQSSFHQGWVFYCCCPAAVAASHQASLASLHRLHVSLPPSDVLLLHGGDVPSQLQQRSQWRTVSCVDAKSHPHRLPGPHVPAGQAEEELSPLLFAVAGWGQASLGPERHPGCGTGPEQLENIQ